MLDAWRRVVREVVGRRLNAGAVGMRRERRAADLIVDGCLLAYGDERCASHQSCGKSEYSDSEGRR